MSDGQKSSAPARVGAVAVAAGTAEMPSEVAVNALATVEEEQLVMEAVPALAEEQATEVVTPATQASQSKVAAQGRVSTVVATPEGEAEGEMENEEWIEAKEAGATDLWTPPRLPASSSATHPRLPPATPPPASALQPLPASTPPPPVTLPAASALQPVKSRAPPPTPPPISARQLSNSCSASVEATFSPAGATALLPGCASAWLPLGGTATYPASAAAILPAGAAALVPNGDAAMLPAGPSAHESMASATRQRGRSHATTSPAVGAGVAMAADTATTCSSNSTVTTTTITASATASVKTVSADTAFSANASAADASATTTTGHIQARRASEVEARLALRRSAALGLRSVLTAHGLLSPIALHGWWSIPRITLLLPLLPVMDINVTAPNGELIGSMFTLSRVLTLTDLLMIATRGDVTQKMTATISEDFEIACAWYGRSVCAFIGICALGSTLPRRTSNGIFSVMGLVLVAWELCICGYFYPLACSLVMAYLSGFSDGDAPPKAPNKIL